MKTHLMTTDRNELDIRDGRRCLHHWQFDGAWSAQANRPFVVCTHCTGRSAIIQIHGYQLDKANAATMRACRKLIRKARER